VTACFWIGALYPITQIYQHEQDQKDNVETISMRLGVKGTFIFTAVLYFISFVLMAITFHFQNQLMYFGIIQILLIPVIIRYIKWMKKCFANPMAANFKNTMSMSWYAAIFINSALLLIILIKQFG